MKNNFNDDSLSCSGIYAITCKPNGKVYIGSAVNLRGRLKQHYKQLIENNHHNRHLQNAWKKHEECNFYFTVLEPVTDKTLLIEREQFHIDRYPLELRFNLSPTAGSPLGVKHSAETIAKLVASHPKGKFKHTAEVKKQIAAVHLKFTPEEVRQIRHLRATGVPLKTLGQKYKVKRHTIARVVQGTGLYAYVPGLIDDAQTIKLIRTKRPPATAETRAKLSKLNSGRIRTDEHKQRVAACNSMFSPEQVDEIRQLRQTGLSFTQLGQRFKSDHETIARVVKGRGFYGNIGSINNDAFAKKLSQKKSPEMRAKLSLTRTGKKYPRKS